jgi:esterase/lipase superfamily enzyme
LSSTIRPTDSETETRQAARAHVCDDDEMGDSATAGAVEADRRARKAHAHAALTARKAVLDGKAKRRPIHRPALISRQD